MCRCKWEVGPQPGAQVHESDPQLEGLNVEVFASSPRSLDNLLGASCRSFVWLVTIASLLPASAQLRVTNSVLTDRAQKNRLDEANCIAISCKSRP